MYGRMTLDHCSDKMQLNDFSDCTVSIETLHLPVKGLDKIKKANRFALDPRFLGSSPTLPKYTIIDIV